MGERERERGEDMQQRTTGVLNKGIRNSMSRTLYYYTPPTPHPVTHVSLAMTLLPMAACTAISNICLGMEPLRRSHMAFPML